MARLSLSRRKAEWARDHVNRIYSYRVVNGTMVLIF